eukprot:GHVL01034261.1.p1 GENE.GHVL01034261.1~~GHVL01034261.1.p1  ORF type:complete len:692 (-),score=124.92 GHVL01034261.1:2716-4791(-)
MNVTIASSNIISAWTDQIYIRDEQKKSNSNNSTLNNCNLLTNHACIGSASVKSSFYPLTSEDWMECFAIASQKRVRAMVDRFSVDDLWKWVVYSQECTDSRSILSSLEIATIIWRFCQVQISPHEKVSRCYSEIFDNFHAPLQSHAYMNPIGTHSMALGRVCKRTCMPVLKDPKIRAAARVVSSLMVSNSDRWKASPLKRFSISCNNTTIVHGSSLPKLYGGWQAKLHLIRQHHKPVEDEAVDAAYKWMTALLNGRLQERSADDSFHLGSVVSQLQGFAYCGFLLVDRELSATELREYCQPRARQLLERLHLEVTPQEAAILLVRTLLADKSTFPLMTDVTFKWEFFNPQNAKPPKPKPVPAHLDEEFKALFDTPPIYDLLPDWMRQTEYHFPSKASKGEFEEKGEFEFEEGEEKEDEEKEDEVKEDEEKEEDDDSEIDDFDVDDERIKDPNEKGMYSDRGSDETEILKTNNNEYKKCLERYKRLKKRRMFDIESLNIVINEDELQDVRPPSIKSDEDVQFESEEPDMLDEMEDEMDEAFHNGNAHNTPNIENNKSKFDRWNRYIHRIWETCNFWRRTSSNTKSHRKLNVKPPDLIEAAVRRHLHFQHILSLNNSLDAVRVKYPDPFYGYEDMRFSNSTLFTLLSHKNSVQDSAIGWNPRTSELMVCVLDVDAVFLKDDRLSLIPLLRAAM